MLEAIKKFLKEEDGLTAVEYAVCGGVVTAGMVAFFGTIGSNTSSLMSKLSAAINTAANPSG